MTLPKKAFPYVAAFVVFLIVAGFGAVQYIQKSVADAIKTEVAQLPETVRPTLGDVTYSLFKNTITIKDLQLTTKLGEMPVSARINLLTVNNPNPDLIEVLADPNKPLPEAMKTPPLQPLADSFQIETVSVGPTLTAHLDTLAIAGIRVDPVKAQAIIKLILAAQGKDQEDAMQEALTQVSSLFPETVAYTSLDIKNFKASIPSEVGPITLEMAEEHQKDYDRGHLGSFSVTGIKVAGSAIGELAVAEISASDLNPPSQALNDQLSQLFLESEEPAAKDIFPLLSQVFAGSKPMLAKLEMKQAQCTLPGIAPLSIERFVYENPKTSPFTYSLAMTNMTLPTDIEPNLAVLKLVGINTLDLSWSVSGTLPNATDGLCSKKVSLSVADMGSMQLDALGQIDPKTYTSLLSSSEPFSTALEQIFNAIRVSKVTMNYTDTGLLPRATQMSMSLVGQTVEQSLADTKQGLQTLPEKDQNAIMSFLEHPGSIEIVIAPKQPLSLEELTKTIETDPSMTTFTATPGQKSLQELIAQLKKK